MHHFNAVTYKFQSFAANSPLNYLQSSVLYGAPVCLKLTLVPNYTAWWELQSCWELDPWPVLQCFAVPVLKHLAYLRCFRMIRSTNWLTYLLTCPNDKRLTLTAEACLNVIRRPCSDARQVMVPECSYYLLLLILRSVSGTGNWHPIPMDRVPAVAMIGWHVARHWSVGDRALPPSSTGLRCQNGVNV